MLYDRIEDYYLDTISLRREIISQFDFEIDPYAELVYDKLFDICILLRPLLNKNKD